MVESGGALYRLAADAGVVVTDYLDRGVASLEVFPYLDLRYRDESIWSAGRVTALEG